MTYISVFQTYWIQENDTEKPIETENINSEEKSDTDECKTGGKETNVKVDEELQEVELESEEEKVTSEIL